MFPPGRALFRREVSVMNAAGIVLSADGVPFRATSEMQVQPDVFLQGIW